jgi:hypothetical protein
MGLVYADVELINSGDIGLNRHHVIDNESIRSISFKIFVEKNVRNLFINETIQNQLDLPFLEKRKVQLNNGEVGEYDIVGPVVLKFKNRQTVCFALVLQGDSEPLLGAIPLEDMDVLIHPSRQELIVNPDHPYYAQMKLKGVRH